MISGESTFPTPFVFDTVMYFTGLMNGGSPYSYSYIVVPTDPASFAAPNFTWSDARTQPTWAYITTGAGWMNYDAIEQNGNPVSWAQGNVAFDALAPVASSGAYSDLSGKPSLAAVATSGAYSDLTGAPTLATVATSGSYNDLVNKPPARATSVVSRSFGSAFQVSASRDAMVSYTTSISSSLSLTTGQSGTVSLQICPTATGTFVEQARFSSGLTGTLVVGLAIGIPASQPVSCFVPAGYYVKLVESGTATIAYVTGQETLM